MRIKLLLIALNICLISNFAWGILEMKINAVDPPKMREKCTLSIPKGAFFKAILQENISTETNNKFDTVTAIVPTNFYMIEQLLIPKSSIFKGVISDLQFPKKGRHGLFKVKFNKILTPSGEIIPISASLWIKGSTQVGGSPSELAEIKVVTNKVENLSPIGYLNVVKTGEYLMGKDVSVQAGTEILIKLDKKLDIKI